MAVINKMSLRSWMRADRRAILFAIIKPLAQISSWLLLGLITVLNVVPPAFRPVTNTPHDLEHFAIFFITGAAFSLGYELRIVRAFLAAILYCAAIELLQNISPGRHARLSDFIVDSAGACVGIALATLLKRSVLKQEN